MRADRERASASELRLVIADIVVSLSCESGVFDAQWFDAFRTKRESDAIVRIYPGELPQLSQAVHEACDFHGQGWCFFYDDGQYMAVFGDASQQKPIAVVTFSESARDFDFYMPCAVSSESPVQFDRQFIIPLMLRLSECGGGLLHSSGIKVPRGGVLFTGSTGVGKTTMARLWMESGSGLVLNDEVCAVKPVGGQYRVYGTPWAGNGRLSGNEDAPIRGIFFLEHGYTNEYVLLGPARAFSQIAPQVLLPRWDAGKTQQVLDTCADLVEHVPCYRLAFRPSHGVVDLVCSILDL